MHIYRIKEMFNYIIGLTDIMTTSSTLAVEMIIIIVIIIINIVVIRFRTLFFKIYL